MIFNQVVENTTKNTPKKRSSIYIEQVMDTSSEQAKSCRFGRKSTVKNENVFNFRTSKIQQRLNTVNTTVVIQEIQ